MQKYDLARLDRYDHYLGLSETIGRIVSAPAVSEVWEAVTSFIARFGYTYVVAVDASKVVGGIREAVIFSNEPSSLLANVEQYFADYQQHPYIVRSMRDPSPATASEIRRDPAFAGLEWDRFQSETVRNGEGLILPVYQGSEFRGGLSFGGQQPDVSPVTRSMMQVLAHVCLEKVLQLRDRKGPHAFPLLSVRETQCLRYVAIGHEDAEISRILGISARTVRFHVDSAKTKLGVGSRVQAVAKAMRERIIAV